MAKEYVRIKLFELSDITRIEDLPPILELNYNKELTYLEGFNLSPRDKTLINKWRKEGNTFNVCSYQENTDIPEIKYIVCNAFMETSISRAQSIIDGTVLPRDNRVNAAEYPAIFFEKDRKVYCAIRCSAHLDTKLKSVLMGGGRGQDELNERWGKVKIDDIFQYKFTSDFYYWMFANISNSYSYHNKLICINDAKYINNISDRGESSYSSKGPALQQDIIPKTGLGTAAIVDSLGVAIEVEDEANLEIRLENNGVCYINKNLSSVIKNGKVEMVDDYWTEIILKVYCEIIPGLASGFNEDIRTDKWNIGVQNQYMCQWALEVIEDLCIQNRIDIEQIKSLKYFK